MDWNPDGTRLAVAGSQGTGADLLDAATGDKIQSFPAVPVDPSALVTRARPAPRAVLPPAALPGAASEPAVDPATVVSLSVEPGNLTLQGIMDSCQVLVTAGLRDGTTADVTRMVKGTWSSPLAAINSTGLIKPTGDGSTTLTFSLGSAAATLPVEVRGTAPSCIPISSAT